MEYHVKLKYVNNPFKKFSVCLGWWKEDSWSSISLGSCRYWEHRA